MEKYNRPTLNLIDIRDLNFEHDHFRIDSMKNTVEFRVGKRLSEDEVRSLIDNGWNISVKAAG